MSKFDDWEVLPLDAFDAIGKKFDEELKKRLHEAVDEMLIQAWCPIYQMSNTQCLELLQALVKSHARTLVYAEQDDLLISVEMIPDDFEDDLMVDFSLAETIKNTFAKEERKRVAEALRRLADKLDA